ncbi:hypothetical protein FBU30_008152 [Linnemannia zychae]|nr:hypothetical protein FBU30_008152 [Linnemannia zychae]
MLPTVIEVKHLEPLRIAAIPNDILDIIVDGSHTRVPVSASFDEIKRHGAKHPKIDPTVTYTSGQPTGDTLRHVSDHSLRHNSGQSLRHTSDQSVNDSDDLFDYNYRTMPTQAFWNENSITKYISRVPSQKQGRELSHPLYSASHSTLSIIPRSNHPAPSSKPQPEVDVKDVLRSIIRYVDLTELEQNGEGSPQDFLPALKCYLSARKQKGEHKHALLAVGKLFDDGEDVEQDDSRAYDCHQPIRSTAAPETISEPAIAISQIEPAVATDDATSDNEDNDIFYDAPTFYSTSEPEESGSLHCSEIAQFENTMAGAATDHFDFPESLNTYSPQHSGEHGLNSNMADYIHKHLSPQIHTTTYAPISTVPGRPQYTGAPIRPPQNPQTIPDSQAIADTGQQSDIHRRLRNTSIRHSPQLNMDSFEQTLANAQYGDTMAQVRLGDMYLKMNNAEQDNIALSWYLKAALHRDPCGQHCIGLMFLQGRGVNQSFRLAMEWLQKAADQGKTESLASIGYMYERGLGVLQDYNQAFEWYRKGATQGCSQAQNNIGAMYENGSGFRKNYSKAAKWYKKAADQGNEIARKNLIQLEEKQDRYRHSKKPLS